MMLLSKLKRFLCLRRHRSTVSTGLVPLSAMSSVIIYLDSAEDLTEPHKLAISRFFKQHGMELRFLHSDDQDLRSSSDLFISLSAAGDINERYAASSSQARFKIGRHQLKGDIYDFIVTDNGTEPVPVPDAYKVIEQFITTIQ